MKKLIIVGAIVAVVVAALGVAGYAYAQTTPPTPVPGQGFGRGGMMGGQRGMMGRYGVDGTYGPMHEYMVAAIAEALGMTDEDLDAALESGKTMWQVAEEQGLSAEEFQTVMLDAREKALAKLVADGVITQEQADSMLSRMQGRWSQGGCPMGDGFGTSRGPGGRWNNQPAPAPTGSGL